MSNIVLIQDKKVLPPTYQSLSTPISPLSPPNSARTGFSTNNSWNNGLLLNCCYFLFFILTITAISYTGYCLSNYQNKGSGLTTIDKKSTDTIQQIQPLDKHHYKLIENDSSDYREDYREDDREDDREDYREEKIHEHDSKLEISDVVGDVYVGPAYRPK